MHLTFGGGGSRAIVYASLLQRLSETKSGQQVLNSIQSVSGVSAGAMVASVFAMGVKPASILDACRHSVFEGSWSYYPRMLFTAMQLQDHMYDSALLSRRLHTLCDGRVVRMPLTVAVTPPDYDQKCLTYSIGSAGSSVVPAVTASSAVPFLFKPVHLQGLGDCIDGGADKFALPMAEVRAHVQKGHPVIIGSSGPWPGFRQSIGKTQKELLFRQLSRLTAHSLEGLASDLGPNFKFHDGVFRCKNVTFLAPKGAVYAANGGYSSSGKVRFGQNSKHVERLINEGRGIADEYVAKFGILRL